jgi:hypothetical protein
MLHPPFLQPPYSSVVGSARISPCAAPSKMNALDFLVDFVTVTGVSTAPQVQSDDASNDTQRKTHMLISQEPSIARPKSQSSSYGNAPGALIGRRRSPPSSSSHHDILQAAFAEANKKMLNEHKTRACRTYVSADSPLFEQYTIPQVYGHPHSEPNLCHHEPYQRQYPVWRLYNYTPGCAVLAPHGYQGPPQLRLGSYEKRDATQPSMLDSSLPNGFQCCDARRDYRHLPLPSYHTAPLGAASGRRDSVEMFWSHMDERTCDIWHEAMVRGYHSGFGHSQYY